MVFMTIGKIFFKKHDIFHTFYTRSLHTYVAVMWDPQDVKENKKTVGPWAAA